MKLKIKKTQRNSRFYPISYSATEIDYCCERSKSSASIGFGEKDSSFNEIPSMCIYNCEPYPEGAVWDEEPIAFCPFCGAKIEEVFCEGSD
jgi:hypothetical protein